MLPPPLAFGFRMIDDTFPVRYLVPVSFLMATHPLLARRRRLCQLAGKILKVQKQK